MKRKRFYLSNGKNEAVQEFLKKNDDRLLMDFAKGEERFVFVDMKYIRGF